MLRTPLPLPHLGGRPDHVLDDFEALLGRERVEGAPGVDHQTDRVEQPLSVDPRRSVPRLVGLEVLLGEDDVSLDHRILVAVQGEQDLV